MRITTLKEAQRIAPAALHVMAQHCYTEWQAVYNVDYDIHEAQGVYDDFSRMNNTDSLPYAIVALDDDDSFAGCFAVQLEDDLKDLDKGPAWVEGPWLVCMFVAPEHRGKGLMRQLLTAMLDWVDRHLTDWPCIYLWTENVARTYSTVGFQHLRDFTIPYSGVKVDIMQRPLPAYRSKSPAAVRIVNLVKAEQVAPHAIYDMSQAVLAEWTDIYVKQYGLDTVDKVVGDFRQMMNTECPSFCLVALEEGTNKFAGCCAIQNEHELLFDFDKGSDHVEGPWVVCMYVKPEFRGQGIMRRLLSSMMEWVDKHCRQWPYVYLWTGNVAKVYASVGFELVADIVTCGTDQQLMRRPVGAAQ